jgi:gas vesicle protein
MSDESRGGEFLAGLILGGLIGAAAALLLAPQPGDETRAELREKGVELKDRMIELSEEARRKAEDLQAESRAAVEAQKVRVEEAIEEGKKAAAKKKKELLEELDQERGTSPA